MSKKLPTVVKDGLVGLGIGTAVIIPGISGGTIALASGAFEKITSAVSNLFSKNFFKNLLILLPFGIGAILAVAALYFPFSLAFEYCMLAIVGLFAGLILGSLPGIFDQVKGQKPTKINVILLIIGILFAALIGVTSVVLNLSSTIDQLFTDSPFYLYLIVLVVGLVSSAGLIVPGLSGSLILLVVSFYEPIFNLLSFSNGWESLLLLVIFAMGVGIGFVFWSKLMNSVITKHRQSTMYTVLGFIIGSLFSIFFNSKMIGYIKTDAGTLDAILTPILSVIGIILGYLFVIFTRRHKAS